MVKLFHQAQEVDMQELLIKLKGEIIIWYKFVLLLDRVFSELCGTNFNPQFLRY